MIASTTVHLRIGLMLLVHRKPPWRSDSAPRAAENGSHQPLARLGLELGTPRGSVVWRALQRLRELFEWAWVPGFVQADLAGAGDRKRSSDGRVSPFHERASVTASSGLPRAWQRRSTPLGRSCRGCARTR